MTERSAHPIGQSSLDRCARVQRAEHNERTDGRPGELGRNIQGNAGKAQDPNVEDVSGVTRGLEVLTAEMSQPKIKALARRRLLHDIGVPIELVTNGRADEVGPIRIKTLLHHQIDVAKVDIAEVDGDLFGVTASRTQLVDCAGHRVPYNIP